MIALLTLFATVSVFRAVAAGPGTSAAAAPLSPATVVARYAKALQKIQEPSVITFDYTLSQTGSRTLEQTHRVFRAGDDERDETLTVDGKRLTPPKVRIFRGRRNRYTLALLAPRPADYRFALIETEKDGHHLDYVFRTIPKTPSAFNITSVIIDGARFLPLAIDFTTGSHAGAGRISFGSNARWGVPYFAPARATVAADAAIEQLTFYSYRFPLSLPPTTFGQFRPAPTPPPETVPAPAGPFAPASVPLPVRAAAPRRRPASLIAPVDRVLSPGAARPFVPLATPVNSTFRHAPPPAAHAAPRPTVVPIVPGLRE